MTTALPLSPIHILAAQWRVLGMMAVAIGRQVSLATKMRSRAGVHEAEMLEAFLYAALVKLSRQIAVYSENGVPTCPEEARALEYLKSVHIHLSILALLITQMRRDLEAETDKFTAFQNLQRPIVIMVLASTLDSPPFLDSS